MGMIKKLIKDIEGAVKVDGSYKNIAAGVEGMDESIKGIVLAKREELKSGVESAFAALDMDGTSDIEISPVQLEAAKTAAIYAVDPMETLKRFSKGRIDGSTTNGMEATVVDNTQIVADMIPNNQLMAGIESFDGQVLASSLHVSIAYNTLAIKQDAVSELFFPIVVIDPSQAGASVSAKITNIMTATKRDISGKPVDFKKESIIKKLNDTSLFELDANRLYPVVRDESADKLLIVAGVDGLTHTVEVMDGVKVETAPIRTSVRVDVLGISQSDELIAKGIMDETDALDRHLSVDKLYFKVSGKDADGNDVVEYHSKNIKGLPATFTYTPTGSSKGLQLDYQTSSIAWIGGDITDANGVTTKIADLAGLPAGYTVKLKLNLKGDGDAQTANVAIYPVEIGLDGVLDANGVPIAETSAIYTKMAAIFDAVTMEGYDLDAYATNSNARFRGKMLTTNTYTYYYTVPTRTKLRELTPIFDSGTDGDSAGLLAQIDFTKRALGKAGLSELNNAAVVLASVSADTDAYGISSKLVNKYFYRDALNLNTVVDSIKSSDREGDITSALKLTIRNMAVSMYVGSNYNLAFEAIYPGAKPTIIIGTDVNIGRFISSFEDEIFKYEVRISNDNLIAGKLFASFSIMDAERNRAGNPLSFGVCLWSPEVVIALQRTENGSAVQETITMPRYKHQTLMPVLSMLEISGIESVSGKLPVNFAQV